MPLALAAIFLSSQPAKAEVIFGPRFSYYFDNSNLRISDLGRNIGETAIVDEGRTQIVQDLLDPEGQVATALDGEGQASDQLSFPMYGATISFGNDKDRFTFTGMIGSTNGTESRISSSSTRLIAPNAGVEIIDLSTQSFNGITDIDRYDAEFTWQRRIDEKIAVFGGLRYERLDIKSRAGVEILNTSNVDRFLDSLIIGSFPIQNNPAQFVNEDNRATSETYSARIGVTAFVPASQSMTVFFNGMLHASYQPEYVIDSVFSDGNGVEFNRNTSIVRSEFSAGPDIAVGAQYVITDNISMDLRYRAIIFFPLSGDFSFNDARVNHGVNLGVSFRL